MTALEIVGRDEELAVAHDSAVEAGEAAFAAAAPRHRSQIA